MTDHNHNFHSARQQPERPAATVHSTWRKLVTADRKAAAFASSALKLRRTLLGKCTEPLHPVLGWDDLRQHTRRKITMGQQGNEAHSRRVKHAVINRACTSPVHNKPAPAASRTPDPHQDPTQWQPSPSSAQSARPVSRGPLWASATLADMLADVQHRLGVVPWQCRVRAPSPAPPHSVPLLPGGRPGPAAGRRCR